MQAQSREQGALTQRQDILGVRWRLVVLVLVLGLAGAAAGAWWGQVAAGARDASAVILINPLYGNPFSPQGRGDDLVNLETEAQLVTSDTVAQRVSQRMGGGASIDEVLTGVRVKVSPNTQILEIHVRLSSPELARRRAQAFAATYLSYRRLITERTVADQSEQLFAQISKLNRNLRHKTVVLGDLQGGSARARLLDQQINEITTQVGQLRTLLATATSASLDPGQIVTPATVVEPGLLDGPVPMGGLGLLAGVMGALVLATHAALILSRTIANDRADNGSAEEQGRELHVVGSCEGGRVASAMPLWDTWAVRPPSITNWRFNVREFSKTNDRPCRSAT